MKKLQAVILGLALTLGAAAALAQAQDTKDSCCSSCCCCKPDADCCKSKK